MKPQLLLILLLALASSQVVSQQLAQSKLQKENPDFYYAIKLHFQIIDSLHKANPDLMEQEELKFEQLISNNKQYIFNLSDTINFEWLYIAKSADKRLCLVSWDTQMGGTMIDFATIALFKEDNKLFSKMLIETSNESEIENTFMHYDTIYVVSTSQHTFYLAHGFGQGSTALPWQEIKAFEINNNKLINPVIFPDDESNIYVEFDRHEFDDQAKIPMIKVKENGKKILVPEATEKEGFSGKYQTLILKGETYKVQ